MIRQPAKILRRHRPSGTNRLSSLYIRFLNAYAPTQRRIIAVLDHKQHVIGRTMCGVPVVAAPQHLDPVIEEFQVHGIRTDRIIIGGNEALLPESMLNQIRAVCAEREIKLDFLPDLVFLSDLTTPLTPAVKPVLHQVPAPDFAQDAKPIAARAYRPPT